MGSACLVHSVVSGCVAGPRPKTLRELSVRRRLFASVKQADLIAAPSYCVAKILEINGVDRRLIAILPSFTPFADLAEAPPYPASPALLFAARLVQQKGIDDVLWLVRELQEKRVGARIIVAGAGPGLQNFQEAAKSHPALEVRGMLHADALSAAYAESSAVLITPNWLDPFPLIGLDAMAHARPVVAYDIGGIGELVESGVDGIMVSAGDRLELARAVRQILADPKGSAQMGRRGREKVRARYRLRNSLDAAIRAYADAIQLHAPVVG